MFHSSTQRRHWILSTEEVKAQRLSAHRDYIAQCEKTSEEVAFLSIEEEESLLCYYSSMVFEICGRLKPPPPGAVYGTSLQYFKRFYLTTSVMEYHPRDIVYTCVFLATKVEEYNVSISQFVNQVAPNYQEIGEFIISTEMLMMHKLSYHLTIHNPYRPFEGFLMDIKVRVPEIEEPEKYRSSAEKFMTRALLTYVPLLFSPSAIALAAVKSVFGKYIEPYITNVLAKGEQGRQLLENVNSIIKLVAAFSMPTKQIVQSLEAKLSRCLNEENNPRSSHYREKELMERERKEDEKMARYEQLAKQRQTGITDELGVEEME